MLTIGKLAGAAFVTADAVRFYEREGLLAPTTKSAAGYRLYTETALARLRFIQRAKQCGFTLAEIRELLSSEAKNSACCEDVRSRVIEKKLQLEAKIGVMKSMSSALDILIAGCKDGGWPVSSCPILSALECTTEARA